MSLIFVSEYNQTYHTHASCYYCLGLIVCYMVKVKIYCVLYFFGFSDIWHGWEFDGTVVEVFALLGTF